MEKILQGFVECVKEQNLQIEGIAIADKEKVILEHRFAPDRARNIYSHTKSYMSTAVGLAVADGKLSLDDKLAEFFPESLPRTVQPELFDIRLRHLLTMSSGFHHAYLMSADRRVGVGVPDYMAYMLSRPVEVEPGRVFCYSTADSYLAGRMVEKAVGKPMDVYLYERIFATLEQGYPIWETCPQGHPVGGAGMFMKLTDMMKLGQLYLAEGKWKGKQLVDPAWIKEACSKQIDTPQDSIWHCGYGYQFWMSPYPGAYRADGAYGQVTTVLPEAGLVVAVQCPEEGAFEKVRQALHACVFTQL